MAQQPLTDTRISGQIERITFSNAENGYTVARVKVYGRKDLVTVVGTVESPVPGAVLEMEGQWANHPKFGEQFTLSHCRTRVPGTVQGIEKYLGAGLIRGIGPKMARRIVRHFGEKTLEVIDGDIDRLNEVAGIGTGRIAMIREAWAEQQEIRNLMLFLQEHGVSTTHATSIFKEYGNRAVAVVAENPFRLATDIHGIGFVTADRIATSIGIPANAPARIQAGIVFALNEMASDGHLFSPFVPLVERCAGMLGVAPGLVEDALADAAATRSVILETTEPKDRKDDPRAVFLPHFHHCETQIAIALAALQQHAPLVAGIAGLNVEEELSRIETSLSIQLADRQKTAIGQALVEKVMVITGGPGTGKTTIIRGILSVFERQHARILLAAPTGRAAKRMGEATGFTACTLHRLLEFSFAAGGFQRNETYPLNCDLLVVDEMSMVDVVLMHHLLKAVPLHASLLLVGDVDQIPSVGAGHVLGDIIRSNRITVVVLKEIFRQARKSRIIVNAHRIQAGELPQCDTPRDDSDFFFIEKEEPEAVLDVILRLVGRRIPQKFHLDPFEDIQVLTPMHRGIVGAASLNRSLQQLLNPGRESIPHDGFDYRAGDKVMQVRNNYDREVYNGDIGRISRIDREENRVTVLFDGVPVDYAYGDLDELRPAYAVSVHKSQGSEYPAVVIPVVTEHYILLQRNLVYTGITRGKQLVVLVGSRRALTIAVNNDKPMRRYTRLDLRLCQDSGPSVVGSAS